MACVRVNASCPMKWRPARWCFAACALQLAASLHVLCMWCEQCTKLMTVRCDGAVAQIPDQDLMGQCFAECSAHMRLHAWGTAWFCGQLKIMWKRMSQIRHKCNSSFSCNNNIHASVQRKPEAPWIPCTGKVGISSRSCLQ